MPKKHVPNFIHGLRTAASSRRNSSPETRTSVVDDISKQTDRDRWVPFGVIPRAYLQPVSVLAVAAEREALRDEMEFRAWMGALDQWTRVTLMGPTKFERLHGRGVVSLCDLCTWRDDLAGALHPSVFRRLDSLMALTDARLPEVLYKYMDHGPGWRRHKGMTARVYRARCRRYGVHPVDADIVWKACTIVTRRGWR